MEIYRKLNEINARIGAISKDRKNQQQGFMFRGIDQVMNTLHPLLVDAGVVVIPEIVETRREERLTKSGNTLLYTMHTIRYHFTAEDGSEAVATVVGEGMDMADKSSNKAMAVAYKYACFQMFCIPTEEVLRDDPDAYSPEGSVGKDQLRAYIDNCASLDDFAMLSESYGKLIKADPELRAYANAAYSRLKGGAL